MRPLRFLSAVALALLAGCPADDDDSSHTIEPPEGCTLPAMENVNFEFTIHWEQEDYSQEGLLDLMAEIDLPVFSFQFLPAKVTELGPAADLDGWMAITLTDNTPPPKGGEPPEDPNYVRIVYQLPLGYELPAVIDQEMATWVILDITRGDLISAFSLWEQVGEEFFLSFLAEPSDAGMAFAPGPDHPLFERIDTRDRQCPSLGLFPCAKPYNLSVEFEVLAEPPPEGQDPAPGEVFELWPTQHRDFVLAGMELRVVNVWSFAWREIDPDCTNPYDYTRDRLSYFVTRTASSPAE